MHFQEIVHTNIHTQQKTELQLYSTHIIHLPYTKLNAGLTPQNQDTLLIWMAPKSVRTRGYHCISNHPHSSLTVSGTEKTRSPTCCWNQRPLQPSHTLYTRVSAVHPPESPGCTCESEARDNSNSQIFL